MGHEVEACHQKDKVNEEQPMLLERYAAFGNEGNCHTAIRFSHSISFTVRCRLWETKTEEDDEDWGASAKPEKRTPAMRCGIHKTASKRCRQEISKRIALLQHTRYQTTCCLRAILEGRCCCIAIEASHGNAKESTTGEELLVGITKASPELEYDEEDIVDNEGPFPTISIGSDT